MTSTNTNLNKVVKSFCVVGLDENHIYPHDLIDVEKKFITRIDIIKSNPKDISLTKEKDCNNDNTVKKIKLNSKGDYWLRLFYSSVYNHKNPPITKLLLLKCDALNKEYMLLNKKYIEDGYMPVRVYAFDFSDFSKEDSSYFVINDEYVKIPNIFNLKTKGINYADNEMFILLENRSFESLPIKDIKIIDSLLDFTYELSHHSSPYDLIYEASVIDSYPVQDIYDVSSFCFSNGFQFYNNSVMPKTFRFIMTNETGSRLFCSCIVFSEEVSIKVIKALTPVYLTKNSVYYNKAICIVSEYPFFENFKEFLIELYRLQVSSNMPNLEKHISYFVESILINPYDCNYAILYEIYDLRLLFHSQPIYLRDIDYINAYSFLPIVATIPFNLLYEIFKVILLEGKIIFTSKSKNLLSTVISSIPTIIFPFKWPHVLIPILPKKMQQFLEAPVPFIIGISYNINSDELSDDIMLVSLDYGFILKYPKEEIPDPPKVLTEKLFKKLKKIYTPDFSEELDFFLNTYDEIYSNLGIFDNILDKFDSNEFKDSFFEFFLILFKNYDKYFKVDVTCSESLIEDKFNIELLRKDFNSNDKDSFIYRFTDTNIFSLFIDENYTNNRYSELLLFFTDYLNNGKGNNNYYLPPITPTANRLIEPVQNFISNGSPKINPRNNTSITSENQIIMKLNSINIQNNQNIGNNNSFVRKQSSIKLPYAIAHYSTFPKLDPSKYLESSKPKNAYYAKKFIFQHDEWFKLVDNIQSKDWPKYLYLMVVEIWIQLAILYLSTKSDLAIINEIINLIMFIMNDMTKSKKINPSKNLFYKLSKFLASLGLIFNIEVIPRIKDLLKIMPGKNQYNAYYALLDGLAKHKAVILNTTAEEKTIDDANSTDKKDEKKEISIGLENVIKKTSFLKNSLKVFRSTNQKTSDSNKKLTTVFKRNSLDEDILNFQILLGGSAFICVNYCESCEKQENIYNMIAYEEILCGFKRYKLHNIISCPSCSKKLIPKLYIVSLNQLECNSLEIVDLVFIKTLIKEIEKEFRNNGEANFLNNVITKYTENKNLFWNMIFYFKYFSLPLFIFDKHSDYNKIRKDSEETKSLLIDTKNKGQAIYYSSTGKIISDFSFFKSKNQAPFTKNAKNATLIKKNLLEQSETKVNTSFIDWEKIIHKKM